MENKQGLFQSAGALFESLARQYPFAEYDRTGRSLLGRELSLLQIGNGDKTVLMVAGADAGDRLSEALLMQFASDFCAQVERGGRLFGLNAAFAARTRRILILPCLNPDGKALTKEGADPSCPLYERQLRQNGMKSDFSAWQGNARGVHLDRNYNDGFADRRSLCAKDGGPTLITGEYPESEPECTFAARLVHTLRPTLVLECGKASSDTVFTNRPSTVAQIAQSADCPICQQLPCGLPSWAAATYDCAAIHLGLQPCKHEISIAYLHFRELLFRCLYTLAV